MKIQRYVAKDMRSALAQVRDALGPDAVILSSGKVDEGVEVVAAIDFESQRETVEPVRNDRNPRVLQSQAKFQAQTQHGERAL